MRPGGGPSRFLIGLVTCFAVQDVIPAVAHAACSPTLVAIMATSCLANVGRRGGRVAWIPARVILRRRGCLASPKASPRSGDSDHFADIAGLATYADIAAKFASQDQ